MAPPLRAERRCGLLCGYAGQANSEGGTLPSWLSARISPPFPDLAVPSQSCGPECPCILSAYGAGGSGTDLCAERLISKQRKPPAQARPVGEVFPGARKKGEIDSTTPKKTIRRAKGVVE